MTTFWPVATVLFVLAAGVPLLLVRRAERRRGAMAAADRDARIAHCRDALAALERERAQGLIDDAAFDAERAVIARRLLAVEAAEDDDDAERPAPTVGWKTLALLVVLALVGGVALHLALGRPDLPAASAQRQAADRSGEVQGDAPAARLPELVEELAGRLKEHPERVDGWRLLARTALDLGRTDLVLEAAREGLQRAPDDRELLLLRAEALIARAGGRVTPAAVLALEELARRDRDHPAPRYYAGLKRLQDGDAAGALEIWRDLLDSAPEDAPWRARIVREIERVETMQAMRDASPQARLSMIRAMVARLEERLARTPEDAQGWQRLARSYLVLGETDKARHALERLRDLLPPARRTAVEREIARLRREGTDAGASVKETPE